MALEVELLSEFIPFGYSYAKETQTLSGKVPSNPVSLPALDLGVRRPGSSDALRENVPSLTGCYALSEVRAFASDGRTRLQGAEARGVVGEEELYVVGTTVICSRGCHGCVGSDGKEHVDGHAVITATFNFEHLRQPIRQVLWAWFAPTMELSDDFVGSRESTSPVAEKQAVGNGPSRFPAERSCLDRALCVLFRDFAVFQFDDGRSFTANMSFVVQRAFALDGPSGGLLLQKAKSDERGPDLEANTEPGPLDSVPGSLFTLMHPLEEPRTVSVLSEVPSIVVSDASGSRAATGVPFDDFDEHVVFVSASGAAPDPTCLIVSHNAVSGKHSVWTYVHRVLGDSERNSLFPPLRRPSMASASDSLVDGVPQATSPSLGGASSSKASGSARRQSKAKKVQLAHAPKRPSLLSLHAETPDLSREFGVVEASVRRSSVEPAGVVDGDDEEYHKAVTTWQTAPVVSLIKLWEQNASSATPTSSSACVTHTSSGEEVLTLFNLERRSMLSLLVSKTAGAGPSEQPRQVRVNHLFSLDACSVAPVYATRTARRDLLILKTDWALSLWAGDMERGDSGAVQPVFIPCEVPYNFQERIPSRESSKAALRPIVKKRRRDASGDTSDSDGGGMNEGDGAESASTNAPSSASKADAAADGDDKVLRSPARSSRVVGLTDPVGSRVNFVLSNGIVIRAALDYTDRQGRLVSLVLEALAHALPERHYSMFWHRFLKLQYGGAAKIVPYGAGPAIPGESGFAEGNSDWDNLLVAFFSFCHLTPRKRPGMQPRPSTDHGAAHGHEPPRDGPVASWNRLLSTDFHCRLRDDPIFRNFALVAPTATQTAGHGTPRLLRLFELSREVYVQNYTDTTFCGSYGTLLSALHLVYEDLKVDVLTQGEIRRLVQLLFQLAVAASSRDHDDHYRRDGFAPDAIVPLEISPVISNPPLPPADIYRWVYDAIKTRGITSSYPTITDLRKHYSIALGAVNPQLVPHTGTTCFAAPRLCAVYKSLVEGGAQICVEAMVEWKLMPQDLDCLPDGLALPLREALRICRAKPPKGWSGDAYTLLAREDLAEQVGGSLSRGSYSSVHVPPAAEDSQQALDIGKLSADATSTAQDGVVDRGRSPFSEVQRLRFFKDRRLEHVAELLQTEVPVRARLAPQQDDDPAEVPAKQQAYLTVLASRTFAIPAGRAIFDFASVDVLASTDIENRSLAVTAKFGRSTVTLDLSPFPTDSIDWPEFHDGVATGLRISPDCPDVDSSWIVYHRPDDVTTPRHAGFLLALGLNGHLRKMSSYHSLTYLTSKHDLTSIGLLLGLSAAHVGTCNDQVTRMLAVHVPALLPQNASDMNVSSATQIASVLGIGLVYMKSLHRRNVEVLLNEIGRRDTPMTVNESVSVNQFREGYSIACGFALGFITLGKGNDAAGLSDLRMVDELFRYMNGGTDRKRDKEMLKARTAGMGNMVSVQSAAYRETDKINVDVTAPGALIALGLMFLRTENEAIASKLVLPDSPVMMDYMRPDFMMLRVMCRSLIMWSDIKPTRRWVMNQSPEYIRSTYQLAADPDLENEPYDAAKFEAVTMALYNIVAGACLSIALKYAGTGHAEACKTLLFYFDWFYEMLSSPVVTVADKVLRVTVRTCVDTTLVCAAVVMAGTGDLEVLRRTRRMFGRVSSEVSYGDHMATTMAMGFLFLAKGAYTLGTSDIAIAALFCCLYPKFPTHVSDNRAHLQAMRHLWVLAAEPRCLVTRDVETREVCQMPVTIAVKAPAEKGMPSRVENLQLVTPCLFPEWDRLVSVSIESPRYYPVAIDLRDGSEGSARLTKTRTVFVKRKTGHLSYNQDPRGFKSLFARSFPKVFGAGEASASADGGSDAEFGLLQDIVKSFSADPHVLAFATHLCVCEEGDNPDAVRLASFCTSVLRECLAQDKPDVLQTYLALYQTLHGLATVDCEAVWNAKLVVAFYRSQLFRKMAAAAPVGEGAVPNNRPLLNENFVAELDQQTETVVGGALWDGGGADPSSPASVLMGRYMAGLAQGPDGAAGVWTSLSGADARILGRTLAVNDIPRPEAMAAAIARVRAAVDGLDEVERALGSREELAAAFLTAELPSVPWRILSAHLAGVV